MGDGGCPGLTLQEYTQRHGHIAQFSPVLALANLEKSVAKSAIPVFDRRRVGPERRQGQRVSAFDVRTPVIVKTDDKPCVITCIQLFSQIPQRPAAIHEHAQGIFGQHDIVCARHQIKIAMSEGLKHLALRLGPMIRVTGREPA